MTASCSFSGIFPEYRAESLGWKSLPDRSWVCTANIGIEHPIVAGRTAEGDFLLKTLQPGYDLMFLTAPGKYDLRFKFTPIACLASPDARFCLTKPSHPSPAISNELTWEVK